MGNAWYLQALSDIVAADLRELSTQSEEPEKLFNQLVVEIRGAIREVTQQTIQAITHQKAVLRALDRVAISGAVAATGVQGDQSRR